MLQRGCAQACGGEKHQSETLQRQMGADGRDQQHQHRGVGNRLERDAIEEQADRRDDQQRQHDIDRDRGFGSRE